MERRVKVEQPEDVNSPDSLVRIGELEPDLLVTAAYGQILSGALLSIPQFGGINLHGSILPAYRGAAPALCHSKRRSGDRRHCHSHDAPDRRWRDVSIARTPIDPEETAGELETRLANLALL